MRTKLGRKSQGLVHIFLISLISLYQLFPKWRYKLGHLQMNVNMWGGLPLNWEHLCFPSQPLPHLSLASRATGMDWDAKFCNRQRMHLCKNEEKEWKRNHLIWNFNSTSADLICLRTFPDKQAAGDSFSNILRKTLPTPGTLYCVKTTSSKGKVIWLWWSLICKSIYPHIYTYMSLYNILPCPHFSALWVTQDARHTYGWPKQGFKKSKGILMAAKT